MALGKVRKVRKIFVHKLAWSTIKHKQPDADIFS